MEEEMGENNWYKPQRKMVSKKRSTVHRWQSKVTKVKENKPFTAKYCRYNNQSNQPFVAEFGKFGKPGTTNPHNISATFVDTTKGRKVNEQARVDVGHVQASDQGQETEESLFVCWYKFTGHW